MLIGTVGIGYEELYTRTGIVDAKMSDTVSGIGGVKISGTSPEIGVAKMSSSSSRIGGDKISDTVSGTLVNMPTSQVSLMYKGDVIADCCRLESAAGKC